MQITRYYFKIVPRVSKKSEKIEKGPILYFCNHRSWADFFLDSALVGGASYLSRLLVACACPMPALIGYLSASVWFFNRRPGIDRNWFANFFLEHWNIRPKSGVIIYPEGHRNLNEKSLKLKTGCTEVSFKTNVPIQIIICTNKENIMNEKEYTVQKNVTVVANVSKPIYPKDYKSKEEYFQAVQELWNKTWDEAYSCPESETEEGSYPLKGCDIYYCDCPKRRIIPYRILVLVVIGWIAKKMLF